MDGPYRDIGSGFVRLSGLEAPRRARSTISCTEDVLREFLKNARDAGASNVFVATFLRSRRYRTIHVLDDGDGVPETHTESIFEPGVTSRHLEHGSSSGLSLHHIRNASVEARLFNPSSPTAIKAILDTGQTPERSLQSTSRASKTNLLATARSFAQEHPEINTHLGPPSAIINTMLKNNIIPGGSSLRTLVEEADRLGFEVSSRTLKRVLEGNIRAAELVSSQHGKKPRSGRPRTLRDGVESGTRVPLGEREKEGITAILRGAAAAGYLSLGVVRFESSGGRILISADVVEPEDEEL